MLATFADAPLKPNVKAALARLGFVTPTPVQAACFEAGLGQDLIVQARTGSGKTLAFGLPLLDRIDPKERLPQALVLAPTRELALQIARALAPIVWSLEAHCVALTGGAEMRPQLQALGSPRGTQLVVGTPGRVLDHLKRGTLKPGKIDAVVLDEGDHLLDMGFKDELDAVLEFTAARTRTFLFSATVPREVEALALKHLKQPRRITIDAGKAPHADIEHVAFAVPEGRRDEALANLLFFDRPERTLVFCRTRENARELQERLALLGVPAGLISGELEQKARNRALQAFRDGRCHVLVATDVAARGIDVPATTHVVHFSLADTAEAYTHRSGRTGRAGRKGVALSLVTARERFHFGRLVRDTGVQVRWRDLPAPQSIEQARIERLEKRLAETPLEPGTPLEEEVSPAAVTSAGRLIEGLPPGSDPRGLVARLLEHAAELEGEVGFDLAEAVAAEARAQSRPRSRDDRKVPRHERWARRDNRGGGQPHHGRPGFHGAPRHGEDRPHGKPHPGKPHPAKPFPGNPGAPFAGKPFPGKPFPAGKPFPGKKHRKKPG